jgi:hypothetical protein
MTQLLPRFRYHAHGVTLASEIELPELTPATGDPDVVLRRGAVPEHLPGPVTRGPRYEAAPGHYLLHIPGVARYWVKDGREIVVAPEADADDRDVRVFVLSSVMGAVVHQRGLLAIHASAVDVGGRAVLFAGESGTGKSTLATAFHESGHPLIADDLCVVSSADGTQPVVHPGYRSVKLWADALTRVGASLGEKDLIRVGMRKFNVAIPGPPPPAPLPIGRIFMLTNRVADKITLTGLTGGATVATIVQETYRRPMMAALGLGNQHFALCAALGRRVPIVQVDRPFLLGDLRRLVQALEQDIRAAAEADRRQGGHAGGPA